MKNRHGRGNRRGLRAVPTAADVSTMNKRLIILCTLGLLLAAAARASADDKPVATGQKDTIVVDRIVAVVNNSVILNSELMMRVVPMAGQLQNITNLRERERRGAKLQGAALEDMVNEELIHQAALASKLQVSAKEVQNAVEEIKRQNKLDDTQLSEALRMQGLSLAAYRSDVRKQILRMRAINMLVRPRVSVTDDDVKALYSEMERRTAAITKVRLSHILIALPQRPTEEQLAEAKERAANAVNRARAGEDFAKLAEELSDDTRTKPIGGDLGWIERNSIDSEWEVIVFSMGKGETRGPINGPQGLHVFHITDLEQTERKPFDEMKDQLRNQLFRRGMDRHRKTWIEELRKKAHIENKL